MKTVRSMRLWFVVVAASLLLAGCVGQEDCEFAESPMTGPSGTGSTLTYA